MGRRIPSTTNDQHLHYYHQNPTIISLSLVLVAMAATISFTTILCGVFFGRKPKPESPGDTSLKNSDNNPLETSPDPSTNTETTTGKDMDGTTESPEGDHTTKELPLPPALQVRTSPEPFPGNINLPTSSTNSLNQYITKSASSRNFKSTISLKVPRSMSLARSITSFRENKDKIKGAGGGGGKEDSVWTKKIILGGKNRVPDEDEEDIVVRDGKGNRVATYHPRSSSLLPSAFRDDQTETS